jgi:hypothetical protein
LFPKGPNEGGAVDGMRLSRFERPVKALAVGRPGIQWPERIRLVKIVGDDTGKIAGLMYG